MMGQSPPSSVHATMLPPRCASGTTGSCSDWFKDTTCCNNAPLLEEDKATRVTERGGVASRFGAPMATAGPSKVGVPVSTQAQVKSINKVETGPVGVLDIVSRWMAHHQPSSTPVRHCSYCHEPLAGGVQAWEAATRGRLAGEPRAVATTGSCSADIANSAAYKTPGNAPALDRGGARQALPAASASGFAPSGGRHGQDPSPRVPCGAHAQGFALDFRVWLRHDLAYGPAPRRWFGSSTQPPAWAAAMEDRLKQSMRMELQAEMGKLWRELGTEIGELRTDLGKLQTDLGKLRTEMGKLQGAFGQFSGSHAEVTIRLALRAHFGDEFVTPVTLRSASSVVEYLASHVSKSRDPQDPALRSWVFEVALEEGTLRSTLRLLMLELAKEAEKSKSSFGAAAAAAAASLADVVTSLPLLEVHERLLDLTSLADPKATPAKAAPASSSIPIPSPASGPSSPPSTSPSSSPAANQWASSKRLHPGSDDSSSGGSSSNTTTTTSAGDEPASAAADGDGAGGGKPVKLEQTWAWRAMHGLRDLVVARVSSDAAKEANVLEQDSQANPCLLLLSTAALGHKRLGFPLLQLDLAGSVDVDVFKHVVEVHAAEAKASFSGFEQVKARAHVLGGLALLAARRGGGGDAWVLKKKGTVFCAHSAQAAGVAAAAMLWRGGRPLPLQVEARCKDEEVELELVLV